jgi:hypothetical protein
MVFIFIFLIHYKFFEFIFVHCRFVNHVLLFQDALTFQHDITLCYSSQFVALQICVFFPKMWVVCEVVVLVLFLIDSSCVLN